MFKLVGCERKVEYLLMIRVAIFSFECTFA
jgi:hypothetical protein